MPALRGAVEAFGLAARVDDLRYVGFPVADGESVNGGTLRVVGKRQKLCEVPVPDSVVERLHLAARGLQLRQ